jgi:Domain of unknown function (DUF1963)
MLQARIESVMERLEERAILAMRPYPPVDLPEICSQLGGLPILPSDTDWPRASDGIPLHFLAGSIVPSCPSRADHFLTVELFSSLPASMKRWSGTVGLRLRPSPVLGDRRWPRSVTADQSATDRRWSPQLRPRDATAG